MGNNTPKKEEASKGFPGPESPLNISGGLVGFFPTRQPPELLHQGAFGEFGHIIKIETPLNGTAVPWLQNGRASGEEVFFFLKEKLPNAVKHCIAVELTKPRSRSGPSLVSEVFAFGEGRAAEFSSVVSAEFSSEVYISFKEKRDAEEPTGHLSVGLSATLGERSDRLETTILKGF